MKNAKLVLMTIVIAIISFQLYNNGLFNSIFFPDRYFKNIVLAPFNFAEKGSKIREPLEFSFDTKYAVLIYIPKYRVFENMTETTGHLSYKFYSKTQLIQEGTTIPLQQKNRVESQNKSSIPIIIFDLPINGFDSDISLELEVIEPISFLNSYSNQTYLRVTTWEDFK